MSRSNVADMRTDEPFRVARAVALSPSGKDGTFATLRESKVGPYPTVPALPVAGAVQASSRVL
jgi:hypothetical protein